MDIIHTNEQYFLIIDLLKGERHPIEIDPNVGVIKQINEAYDKFFREVQHEQRD